MNSLRYAVFAVIVALLLGIFSAVVIVRGKGKFRWLLDTLIMLPLAVPGLVLAFGYVAMSQKGCLFHCFDPVENPTVLLVLAYAVRRLPYVVRAAVAGLQQTSVTYEEAAASLGATPLVSFRRITVPTVLPYFRSALTSALGLGWKAGIAAEVLTVPQRSIGKMIYESKLYLESTSLFAWTLTVILLSLLIERILLKFVRQIGVRGGAGRA